MYIRRHVTNVTQALDHLHNGDSTLLVFAAASELAMLIDAPSWMQINSSLHDVQWSMSTKVAKFLKLSEGVSNGLSNLSKRASQNSKIDSGTDKSMEVLQGKSTVHQFVQVTNDNDNNDRAI